MFKSLGNALNKAASDISRGADNVAKDIGRSYDSVRSCPLLDQFRTGAVVQLISRHSGHALQIVTSPQGLLVVDGSGQQSPTAYNAHWTIIAEGSNIVRLQNNNNFLAIVNGNTVLGSFPPPNMAGPETRFRVTVKDTNYVCLESVMVAAHHIGILKDGAIKSALASGKEIDSQFAVAVVYMPPAPAPGTQTVTVTHVPPPQPHTKTVTVTTVPPPMPYKK